MAMNDEINDVLLTARQVRQRYGGKSDVWLWRALRSESQFPRPIYIRSQRYFRLRDLLAFESACPTHKGAEAA
jgi:predicted DNA-binding transcriptional regulator AlpA